MIWKKCPATVPIFLLLTFIILGNIVWAIPQQEEMESQAQMAESEEGLEEIIPGPQDIKQATGIYVFIVWIWLSISVLIFCLRLKIKEADRLFYLEYFSGKKE